MTIKPWQCPLQAQRLRRLYGSPRANVGTSAPSRDALLHSAPDDHRPRTTLTQVARPGSLALATLERLRLKPALRR